MNVQQIGRTESANQELSRKTDQEPVLSGQRREKLNCLGHSLRSDDSTALQNKYYSGQRRVIVVHLEQREMWREKCGHRLKVQLEKNAGSTTRQSQMDRSSLWPRNSTQPLAREYVDTQTDYNVDTRTDYTGIRTYLSKNRILV